MRALPAATLVLLLLSPGRLPAQDTFRYRAPAGPVCHLTTNPFFLFHVRGSDTLGTRVTERGVECETWTPRSDGFAIESEIRTLGVDPGARHQTAVVTGSGKTRYINGARDTLTGHTDFLLPIPPGGLPLNPGYHWTDTATARAQGLIGEHLYQLIRTFTVARTLDTLGRHLTEIQGTGTARYRDGWWRDQPAGLYTWLDVSGPLEETYYLDPQAGQQVARRWRMHLTGRGGVPDSARDTLMAGLESEQREAPVEPERLRQLGRARPAGDTTYTVDGTSRGLLFAHTVARSLASIASSMARVDGMLGTAESVSAAGGPVSYSVRWTAPEEPDISLDITARADSVRIAGTRTAGYPLPSAPWGIADYAMTEHLVPVWLAMPVQSEPVVLRVYRPYPDKWEDYQTLIRRVDEALLVIMRPVAKDAKDGSQVVSIYLITTDGDLLYGENSDPRGAVRLPKPGTARRVMVERLLAKLRQ